MGGVHGQTIHHEGHEEHEEYSLRGLRALRGDLLHADIPGKWSTFLIALVLSAIAFLPLIWGPGIVVTRAGGDSPFLLVRLQQLVAVLRDGVFPPRWMPDAAYGLGYPFFNYYALLPYYIAAALKFSGFGYLWATKLTQVIGFLAAAAAMYGLAWRLWRNRASAFLAALAYTYAPFHLVNVYVRGDSLSEFYAFVFYPLILWALLVLRESLSPPRLAVLALSYAGLILTHNVSAFLFSPFLAMYILIVFVADPHQRQRWLLYSAAGLALGLILSAWFWWPALAERELGHMADMTTGYFHYSGHFRGPELIQPRFIFDYAVTAQRTPFVMGLVQALAAVGGAMVVILAWVRRRFESFGLFTLLLLALSTYLITPLSRPLWERIPLLPLAQFPWRFLSIQTCASALLAAELPRSLPRLRWVALGLGGLLLIAALGGLRPERMAIEERDVSSGRLRLYELFTGNIGTTVRYEYLPRWAETRPFTSAALVTQEEKAPPLVVVGALTVARLQELRPAQELWEIEVASEAATLAFQTYYFPGWRATVDGKAVAISPLPGLGYIQLQLTQGKHQVILRFGRTPLRAWAEASSLFAFVAIAAILLKGCLPDRRLWKKAAFALLALCALIILVWLLRTIPPRPQAVASSVSDLTMDFARQPYLHHNPAGISFGGQARLKGYRLETDQVKAGETVRLTLLWDQAKGGASVAEVRLVSLAEPLFQVDNPLAVERTPLQAEATYHTLPVPTRTVPGIYLISVRVWDGEQEVPPLTGRGETLGTTYLQPVRVLNELHDRPAEKALASFGPCITLTSVSAVQTTATRLDVELLWQVGCAIPQNYAMSLRLKAADGRNVSAMDLQPHYGLYPTSFWQRGDIIPDRVSLPLPEGTSPGGDYALEIVLYEPKGLQAIGQVTIPSIALTRPTVKANYSPLHRFPPDIDLVAVQPGSTTIEEGQPLVVKTTWAAAVKPGRDYKCRLVVRGETSAVTLQQVEALAQGYPTSQWPQHALIAIEHRLAGVPAGRYQLSLTLLDAGSDESYGTYTLPALLTVKARPRDFAIPKMRTRLDVDLPPIRLLGYDIQQKAKALELTLYWQALGTINTDYKVFVHLFDPAQETIVSQFDAMPRHNTYPTTRWAEGEVVRDAIVLPLSDAPPGTYRLAVGLYNPQNGARLPAAAHPRVTVSDNRIILPDGVRLP